MKNKLVIVESPTKAKTISNIMKQGFTVRATVGHVRDLPKDEFGVDIEKNFDAKYVVIKGKQKIVNELKKLADESTEIYLATDEDREGEAIAWHTIISIGKKPEDAKRVAFHEITPEAVKKAFDSPRKISMDLVNAQQARRILDRLVGYTLSPFLWKPLGKRTSAGRVQSVALLLIVNRETEIEAFKPQTYWKFRATILEDETEFCMDLTEIAKKKVKLLEFTDGNKVQQIMQTLQGGTLVLNDILEKEIKLKPPPPFVTSTLQQMGFSKLGFPSTKTMFVAQQLYEGISMGEEDNIGLITYMRTDSPQVSSSAQNETKQFIGETYGDNFIPKTAAVYKAKLSTAQEAHEAIRPTSVFRTPDKIKNYLDKDQLSLYTMIWERFVASQMKHCIVKNILLKAVNGEYGFQAENNTVTFAGFSVVWSANVKKGIELPKKAEQGKPLTVKEYLSEENQTSPLPRYTEATLIKTLEKFGIGRPSTYAPTIANLKYRNYVKTENKKLVPLLIGRKVIEILVKFFPEIIKVDFTAKMEENLDKIAGSEKDWKQVIGQFYKEFSPTLDDAKKEIQRDPNFIKKIRTSEIVCPNCSVNLIIRSSKYGPFLGCPNYPQCKHIQKLEKNANYSRNRFKKR